MMSVARIDCSFVQCEHRQNDHLWNIAGYSHPLILECPSLFLGILLITPGKHWPCWILIIHRIVSFTGQLTSWEYKLGLVIFLSSPHWTQLLKHVHKWMNKAKEDTRWPHWPLLISPTSLKPYSSALSLSVFLYLWQMWSAMCDRKSFML